MQKECRLGAQSVCDILINSVNLLTLKELLIRQKKTPEVLTLILLCYQTPANTGTHCYLRRDSALFMQPIAHI